MRVIAGSARGTNLKGPGGINIRPTSDRVRQSIFNLVSGLEQDATVLDAFAGTGAMGVEALSRGARLCVFIDKDARCRNILRVNLQRTHTMDRARTLGSDVFAAIPRLRRMGERFDLLFFDPPYDLLGEERGWRRLFDFMAELIENGLVASGAFFVVEHRRSAHPPAPPDCLIVDDARKYGDTAVTIFAPAPPSEGDDGSLV